MRDISILSAVDSLHVIYSILHKYSDWLKTQILHTLKFDSSSHVYLRYLLNNAKYVLDILVPLNFRLLQTKTWALLQTGGKVEPSIDYMRDISILSAVDSARNIFNIT